MRQDEMRQDKALFYIGFKNRNISLVSPIDHIYAFTSLIRNRSSENKSTFCCFIYMDIPMKIYDNNDTLVSDLDTVAKSIQRSLY